VAAARRVPPGPVGGHVAQRAQQRDAAPPRAALQVTCAAQGVGAGAGVREWVRVRRKQRGATAWPRSHTAQTRQASWVPRPNVLQAHNWGRRGSAAPFYVGGQLYTCLRTPVLCGRAVRTLEP
jgi:hypothetical protein